MPFYKIQITKFDQNMGKTDYYPEKTDVLHQAELAAQAEMESYLRERYDVKKYLQLRGGSQCPYCSLYG